MTTLCLQDLAGLDEAARRVAQRAACHAVLDAAMARQGLPQHQREYCHRALDAQLMTVSASRALLHVRRMARCLARGAQS